MPLKLIHTVRHGFRSTWTTDRNTGITTYATAPSLPNGTITGIPTDVSLSQHGVEQAKQLGSYIASLPAHERPQVIYSSPWYRCLQTSHPIYEALLQERAENRWDGSIKVRTHPGLGEWFAPSPHEHPQKHTATRLEQDVKFPNMIDHSSAYEFSNGTRAADVKPWIDTLPLPYAKGDPQVVDPNLKGETIAMLHDRIADTLREIIDECDAKGVERILIASHAAPLIAMGRVLTGSCPAISQMDSQASIIPDDDHEGWQADDFKTYTCGLSSFERLFEVADPTGVTLASYRADDMAIALDSGKQIKSGCGACGNGIGKSKPLWWVENGVGGRWSNTRNSETKFLTYGAERGWHFGEP